MVEASPVFFRPELGMAYGGYLRFKVKSLYGNFSELNSPLDWVTLECASCDGGRGTRLIRFIDESLQWDGSEQNVALRLHPTEFWRRDPLNSAHWMEYQFAKECEIAGMLTGLTRLAILGDFTRGGEGVAIDDVTISAAPLSEQPAYPVDCQRGCVCKHDPGKILSICC